MTCAGAGKCIVGLLNSLFMVVGLGFAVVGVILTFFPDVLLDKVYDIVKDNLDSYLQKGNIKLPESTDGLKDLPFLHELGIALLVLGIFLLIVSLFGWCGATCTSCCRCMLVVFAALLLVVMAAEILTGTMFLVTESTLHKNLRSELKDKISREFNETSGDAFSSIIVFINNFFDCCGIDGVADFGNKTHYSCDYYTGCYTKLTDLIHDNITWAGLILAGLLFLQLLEVIFAIVIFKSANKISPV